VTTALEGVRYHESILETVGNTPLVRLRRVARGIEAPVLAKLEAFNPGGSVKDRIGLAMVEAAEKAGQLKPGGTIVECTSGNTGLGLAMVAAVRGYHAVFCMPDKVSSEKVSLLKAFGAEVLLSPTAVEPESPDSYYSVAKRITSERPGAFLTNQYFNPANPQAHYQTTGPELWEQTGGKITHFVVGMGTGGTISGAGRYLKEKNSRVQIIGADPVGSILKHYKETGCLSEAHTYKIEGVGEDFIPGATDFSVIDRVVSCNDRTGSTWRATRARDAIFVGGRQGWPRGRARRASKLAPRISSSCAADTGERYLSKGTTSLDARNHLLDPAVTRAADVVGSKVRGLPPLLSVQVGDPLRVALTLIEQHDVNQIPVFRGREVAGTLYDADILRGALQDASVLDRPVESLMAEALPVVPIDVSVEQVTRLLTARTPAVLVQQNGSVVGILTRFDMLQFIVGAQ
jgi:cystathionine beta-synthase